MKCPFCGSAETQVIDSRVSEAGDSIRRRRRCAECQKRFTTYETVELRLPQVVKTNGNRSDFDAAKIRVGFQRALHKRPVPTTYVDAAIDRIVQQVLSLGEREIPSRQVGEMVMQELYVLDKVAYIRFASVYRSFQDVSDFRDALKEVEAIRFFPNGEVWAIESHIPWNQPMRFFELAPGERTHAQQQATDAVDAAGRADEVDGHRAIN